jgi:integrase/recombinase XerD
MDRHYFVDFAHWLRNQGKAEGTINTYIEVVNKFKKWLDKQGYKFDEISEVHLQSFIRYLEEDKSPSTVEKYFAALRVYLRFLGSPNIMLNVVRKTKEQKYITPTFLKLSEQMEILNKIKTDGNLRNISIIYLLLHTGIRVSELCNLNLSDIISSDEQSTIIIRNNRTEIDRMIPLSSEAKSHLFSYIDTLNHNETNAVFSSNGNIRMTTRAVQYVLKKYDINPHKLRHTFCYSLINNGVDVGTVANLAGHKDINITKRYLKDSDMNLMDAISKAFAN